MRLRFFHAALLAWLAVLAAPLLLPDSRAAWVAAGLATAVFVGLTIRGVTDLSMEYFGPAVTHGPARPMVALTFDDGPDPATTPLVLDLLARRGVKAAFFCIGENVRRHPDLARRIVDEGHLIGNHTWEHSPCTNFHRRRGFRRTIARTQEAIRGAVGRTPAFFRPPVGLANPHLFPVLEDLGLTCVGFDARPRDQASAPSRILGRLLAGVRFGSIIVLHDSRPNPQDLVAVLDALLDRLAERGLAPARLDRLIGMPGWLEP